MFKGGEFFSLKKELIYLRIGCWYLKISLWIGFHPLNHKKLNHFAQSYTVLSNRFDPILIQIHVFLAQQ